jgi:murein DD-endopeptidase MepM/ murein hydrolase activator NlpD
MFIVLRTHGGPRRFPLKRRHFVACSVAVLLVAVAALTMGYFVGRGHTRNKLVTRVGSLQNKLSRQNDDLKQLHDRSQAGIDAVASRMAKLDARLNRLDAMGAQIVSMSGLDKSGFDFSVPPGEGGPRPKDEQPWALPNLGKATSELDQRIWREKSELAALEAMIMHREHNAQTLPKGKPVGHGWVSSPYGWRTDPFTGKRAFHPGMDFAGQANTPVRAIAAGVVTWAGPHYGYGRLVIVNDGGGYTTWYGHGKKVLVKVGDVVTRGEEIALLGTTGRSTGPHVHLEVRHDGKTVNPWPFVHGKGSRIASR